MSFFFHAVKPTPHPRRREIYGYYCHSPHLLHILFSYHNPVAPSPAPPQLHMDYHPRHIKSFESQSQSTQTMNYMFFPSFFKVDKHLISHSHTTFMYTTHRYTIQIRVLTKYLNIPQFCEVEITLFF